ncbi:hypothetical protein ACHQM5_029580 [Ranunculus cassubicifolius]
MWNPAGYITPEALETVKAALANPDSQPPKPVNHRQAAGKAWIDPTLSDWPEHDFRLFVGNLGNEVTDKVLSDKFSRFPNFNMARVVRDKRSTKSKGFGFVSFSTACDCATAMKEMNGKFVGSRPVTLRKSTWKERTNVEASQRQKFQHQKKSNSSKKSVLHS